MAVELGVLMSVVPVETECKTAACLQCFPACSGVVRRGNKAQAVVGSDADCSVAGRCTDQLTAGKFDE